MTSCKRPKLVSIFRLLLPQKCKCAIKTIVGNWEGALVKWLREEIQNPKVMSLNPVAEYWMDIFFIVKKL